MADEETLLEFPCEYSVKAMGVSAPDFAGLVHSLVALHVDDLAADSAVSKPSSKGKYTSVTITFTARSKAQLDAIYYSLTGHEQVVMAL